MGDPGELRQRLVTANPFGLQRHTVHAGPCAPGEGPSRQIGQFLWGQRDLGLGPRGIGHGGGPGHVPGFLRVGWRRRPLGRLAAASRLLFSLLSFHASGRRFCRSPSRHWSRGGYGIFAVVQAEAEHDLPAHLVVGIVAPDQGACLPPLAPAEVALNRVVRPPELPANRRVTGPADRLVAVGERGQDGEKRLDAGRDFRVRNEALGELGPRWLGRATFISRAANFSIAILRFGAHDDPVHFALGFLEWIELGEGLAPDSKRTKLKSSN